LKDPRETQKNHKKVEKRKR